MNPSIDSLPILIFMNSVENLVEMPLLRGLHAWRRCDIASLIGNKDWEAILEICELRDAFIAEKHAIYNIGYAEAQRLLDWLRRSGWFCLDSERILAKIENTKNLRAKEEKTQRPGFGPIVKFSQKNEKTEKNKDFV